MRIRRAVTGSAALLLGLVGTAAPAAAAEQALEPASAASVRAFLDERVPALLAEFDTPGAAVAVTSRDSTLYQRGYGLADVATGRPVTADGTSFATASVAKSFTATALLQLVDAGRVEVNADVNDYLPEGVTVPDTYAGRPVTLHHLLTHTAGFEEVVTGMAADVPEQLLPLREYVLRHQPQRVQSPGRFTAYSNYGMAMVGLVVEEVTGQEFGAYMAEHVFSPLGMHRTAFAHPADARERLDVPTSYLHGDAGSTPGTDLLLNGLPAGGAYTTVQDTARFVRALLRGGELDGTRVLSEAATAAMLRRQEGNDERLTGAGYGTWQRFLDPEVVGHDGDLPGAHTEYAVVPELGLGIYVAVNGDGRDARPVDDMRSALVTEFLQRFAGAHRPAAAIPVAGLRADPGAYAGTYVATRTSRNDPSALKIAFDQIRVRAAADGTLQTTSPILPEQTWAPLGDGLYQDQTGDRLAFVVEGGEVVGLAIDSDPTQAYERVPWYADPHGHLLVVAGALVVLATTLAWPVAALFRRQRGRSRPAPRAARLVAAGAALICLGFAALFAYAIVRDLLQGLLLTGSTLLQVPLGAAAPLTVAALAAAVVAWRKGWWGLLARAHYTAVALAAVTVVAVGLRYNLVWPL
jgi:CubicO group peptidase (beta-lactamase class C family)